MTFCLRQPQYGRFLLVNAVSEAFTSEAVGAAGGSFPFSQVALTFECQVDWLDVRTFSSQFIDPKVKPRLEPSCSLFILYAVQNTVLHVFSVVKDSVFTYGSQKWGGRHVTTCLGGPLGPFPCPSPSCLYRWSGAALNRLKFCFCLRWGDFPEPTLLSGPYTQGTAEGVAPATWGQYACQSPGHRGSSCTSHSSCIIRGPTPTQWNCSGHFMSPLHYWRCGEGEWAG